MEEEAPAGVDPPVAAVDDVPEMEMVSTGAEEKDSPAAEEEAEAELAVENVEQDQEEAE